MSENNNKGIVRTITNRLHIEGDMLGQVYLWLSERTNDAAIPTYELTRRVRKIYNNELYIETHSEQFTDWSQTAQLLLRSIRADK